jgi:CheY-like chemotaxis protein/two-component sensor histidine kinase
MTAATLFPQPGEQHPELKRLKGLFLASLNHEIRTPLSGILGMTELLANTNLSREQREYVQMTRACAESLHELLSATLEYSSLEAGEAQVEETPFHLVQCIESLAAEHLIQAASKGLLFLVRMDDDMPELVQGDEVRLRRLIGQILSNAIKFTTTGEIQFHVDGKPLDNDTMELQVTVKDTGIGIPPEHLASIFDSFQQIEGGLARQFPGIGIGLSLALRLARLMGGDIQVESKPGQGSTFRVRVPLRVLEGVPEPVAPKESDVLVVEDNEVSQRYVTHVLGKAGYRVECAGDGARAIMAARQVRYSLILMDLQMPGMSGLETASAIRELPGYEEVPILALTANTSSEFKQQCYRHGMQAFLTKPIQSEELVHAVRRHLVA